MIYTTIASGSKGNCTFVSSGGTNILIDAGVSGKKIISALNDINVDPSSIDGIFVTHEHSDHVKGIGVYSRKFDVPIYATEKTWENIKRYVDVGEIKEKNVKYVYKEENFILNDLVIHPFEISHDVADPVGYTVKSGSSKMAVATDLGHITRNVINNLYDCNGLVLESNHDVDMLEKGPYDYWLKKRILGKKGHISNEIAGKLIACIMSNSLKACMLAHLSEVNNEPDLAFDTVKNILEENDIKVGKHIEVSVAPVYGIENVYEI